MSILNGIEESGNEAAGKQDGAARSPSRGGIHIDFHWPIILVLTLGKGLHATCETSGQSYHHHPDLTGFIMAWPTVTHERTQVRPGSGSTETLRCTQCSACQVFFKDLDRRRSYDRAETWTEGLHAICETSGQKARQGHRRFSISKGAHRKTTLARSSMRVVGSPVDQASQSPAIFWMFKGNSL
jgi:hypothetical protein